MVVGVGVGQYRSQDCRDADNAGLSVVLDSVDAMHGDLGLVSEGMVLLLSYSSETSELII